MRVIEVIKTYRNGRKTLYGLVPSDASEAEVIDLAFDIADRDDSGHAYGFDYFWSYVTDEKIIHKVVGDEYEMIDRKITALNKYRANLHDAFPDIPSNDLP